MNNEKAAHCSFTFNELIGSTLFCEKYEKGRGFIKNPSSRRKV